MGKIRALLGLTVMVALLAISAAPAFAEFESTTATVFKGQSTAGKTLFTYVKGGLTVTCESAGDWWSVRKGPKNTEQIEVRRGEHLNILVEASEKGEHGWKKCKASLGNAAKVSACEFQIHQKVGELLNVKGDVITGCTIEALLCTIKVPGTGTNETGTENFQLGKTTLETSGTNLKAKVEVTGITATANSGCLTTLKSAEGTELGEGLEEGVKAI